MQVVVADTGPLNYLVLIGEIEILPTLFQSVATAEAVRAELAHVLAPPVVRAWADSPPSWLTIRSVQVDLSRTEAFRRLDEGERAALTLAIDLRADLVLMDDRAGATAARREGLAVTGTVGLLDLAAKRKLIDLAAAVARLQTTSFRCRPDILEALLERHGGVRHLP